MFSGKDHNFSLCSAGFVALRVALLFGMMGIGLALICVPGGERRSEAMVASELDMITTGSIRADGDYPVRSRVFRQAP